MLLTICGPACSGKDTIVAELSKDYKRLVQHTTRPMRPGEENGVEYFFHKSKEEIKNAFSLKEFTVANGDEYYYWFELDEVTDAIESDELYVTISDIDGTIELFKRNAFVILLNASTEIRLMRYFNRESEKENPDYKEAMRRVIADTEDFAVFKRGTKYADDPIRVMRSTPERFIEVNADLNKDTVIKRVMSEIKIIRFHNDKKYTIVRKRAQYPIPGLFNMFGVCDNTWNIVELPRWMAHDSLFKDNVAYDINWDATELKVSEKEWIENTKTYASTVIFFEAIAATLGIITKVVTVDKDGNKKLTDVPNLANEEVISYDVLDVLEER